MDTFLLMKRVVMPKNNDPPFYSLFFHNINLRKKVIVPPSASLDIAVTRFGYYRSWIKFGPFPEGLKKRVNVEPTVNDQKMVVS